MCDFGSVFNAADSKPKSLAHMPRYLQRSSTHAIRADDFRYGHLGLRIEGHDKLLRWSDPTPQASVTRSRHRLEATSILPHALRCAVEIDNIKLFLQQVDHCRNMRKVQLRFSRDAWVTDEFVDQFLVLFETLECTGDVSLLFDDECAQPDGVVDDQYQGAGYERLRQKLETHAGKLTASFTVPSGYMDEEEVEFFNMYFGDGGYEETRVCSH